MIEIPSLRPETRYGTPVADQLLFNREYIVGYSYLFRQARFAMEVIGPKNKPIAIKNRVDSFRPDLRVPEKFRADLVDFKGSGFDRGHLVSSADRRATTLQNSETFLLTNMSPQHPDLNRRVWRILEDKIRDLAREFVEVFVMCGPLFDVGKKIEVIGKDPTKIPVPHSYFKTILAEKVSGELGLWSFIFENKKSKRELGEHLVSTTEIETRAGLLLWDRLRGADIERMKTRTARSFPGA